MTGLMHPVIARWIQELEEQTLSPTESGKTRIRRSEGRCQDPDGEVPEPYKCTCFKNLVLKKREDFVLTTPTTSASQDVVTIFLKLILKIVEFQ